jgi:mRNA-degrading endonuclease RelE of RelBE toxin-antitoxin system
MPSYRLRWVEEAEKLYDKLPATTRQLVDRRIEELLQGPTGNPHMEHDEYFAQWSIPIGDDKGWILYGIEEDARLVILLRFTPGLD